MPRRSIRAIRNPAPCLRAKLVSLGLFYRFGFTSPAKAHASAAFLLNAIFYMHAPVSHLASPRAWFGDGQRAVAAGGGGRGLGLRCPAIGSGQMETIREIGAVDAAHFGALGR